MFICVHLWFQQQQNREQPIGAHISLPEKQVFGRMITLAEKYDRVCQEVPVF